MKGFKIIANSNAEKDDNQENWLCISCIHFRRVNCPAFPGGIPEGYPPNNTHSSPLSGQAGNYVYEKKIVTFDE